MSNSISALPPAAQEPAESDGKSKPDLQTKGKPVARRRGLYGLLAILAAGLSVQVLSHAWQDTARREAYLPQLESMAQREPQNGRLLALLGARYAEAKEYPAAIRALSSSAQAGEQSEAVWLTWAASYAAMGDARQADAVLRLGMRNAEVSGEMQAAMQRAGRLAAPSPAGLAVAICPQGTHWAAARYAAGSFLNGFSAWRGRRDPARSGFATRQQWAASAPDDAQAQRLWGEALAANHRYPESETVLRHALFLSPDAPATHLALAQALDGEGAKGKAGVEYIACLKRDPNNLAALVGLGNIALEKKLLPIGVETFEKAAKLAPMRADVWIGLGRAHYNQRLNMGRAQEAFATAERLAPGRTDFFNDYANALRGLSRYEDTEVLLRRRLASAPDDAQCRFLLGLVLLDHNVTPERETEAETQLRESLRLQPNVAAVEARLGRLLLDRAQLLQAIPMLQAAIRHDTYNLDATLSLARAYRQAGRLQDAQAAQQSANELSGYQQRVNFLEDQIHRQPENIAAGRELADLYRRGGEIEKARRQEDMLYVLQTHPQQARQGLNRINRATSLTVPAGASGQGH